MERLKNGRERKIKQSEKDSAERDRERKSERE